MQMIALRPSTATHAGDDIAALHTLTRSHQVFVVVGVDGHQIVRVLDNHQPPVAARSPIAENHTTLCGSTDRGAFRGRNINTVMTPWTTRLKLTGDGTLQRPCKVSGLLLVGRMQIRKRTGYRSLRLRAGSIRITRTAAGHVKCPLSARDEELLTAAYESRFRQPIRPS